MCGLQPINMAANVSWTEDKGCRVHIITVRQHTFTPIWHFTSLQQQFQTMFVSNSYICFDSPVIQKIRQGCSKEFVEFERCLRENQDKPTSCTPHVARFLGCAETVDISGVGESSLELALQNSRSHISWGNACVCFVHITLTDYTDL